MAKNKFNPSQELDDADAQDALCYGGKSCQVPPHPASFPYSGANGDEDDNDDDREDYGED